MVCGSRRVGVGGMVTSRLLRTRLRCKRLFIYASDLTCRERSRPVGRSEVEERRGGEREREKGESKFPSQHLLT